MVVVVLVLITFKISYSYFDIRIKELNKVSINITSGNNNLNISNFNTNYNELTTIYDTNYTDGYIINFTLSNEDSNLNICYSINMFFKYISNELISKYFKYRLEDSLGNVYMGDFSNIIDNSITIVNKSFIEHNENIDYKLYMWLSYDESENQVDLLNKKFISNIVINSFDDKLNNCDM